MRAQNQQVPLTGVSPHEFYEAHYQMILVIGHSVGLRTAMSSALASEISRGLRWFLGFLLGGVAIFFVGFSIFFERQLSKRVTKPIMELSRQIKSPKEFIASRDYSNYN